MAGRARMSLYGDDASWFRDVREDMAEGRNGNEPSNAEVVRKLLELYEEHEREPAGGGLR